MADGAISQPQAYDSKGKPIAPEEYAKAAEAGELHFEKGARVYVRNASGHLGSVPAEEAHTEGLQVLTPDQVDKLNQHRLYGRGFGNMAQAAVEGAGRTLTLGGSDALIASAGDEARKGLAGRRAENPVAATGGEVAGMVAPLLLSGGASAGVEGIEGAEAAGGLGSLASGVLTAGPRAAGALGRLAAGGAEALGAEGSGLLATGARLGAQGAAEGALYGAGSTVSQAAIDDTPLTAERLLAGAWDGAKVGGAFGAGAGVLGAGVGKVGRKLLGKLTEGLPPPAEVAEGAAVAPAELEPPVPVEAPPEQLAAPPVEPGAPTAALPETGPLEKSGPTLGAQPEPADFRYGGPRQGPAPAEPTPAAAPGDFYYGDPATAEAPPIPDVAAPVSAPAAPARTGIADYLSDAGPNMLMGILTGHPLTGMVAGAGIKLAKQLIQERGADVMAQLADRLSSVSGRIDLAAKVAAMAERPRALVAPVAVNVPKMFQHYSGLVTESQSEPLKFAHRIGESTADVTTRIPDVAAKMQGTIMADMAYLNGIHPTAPSRASSTLTPQAVKAPAYSFDQKRAFVAAAMALDNPLGVFNDIARGDLPLDAINALKVRRPGLYSEMRESVMTHTLMRKEELPFKRRMLLGVAFDYPADWSMLNIGAIQESLAQNSSQSPHDPHGAPTKVNDKPGEQIAPGNF